MATTTPSKAIIDAWRTAAGLREVPIGFNRRHYATTPDGLQTAMPFAVLQFSNDFTRERTSSRTDLRASMFQLRITAQDLDEAIALTRLAESFLGSITELAFGDGSIQDIKPINEAHEEVGDGAWMVSTDLQVRTKRRP
jgi:hypothetical protein